MIEDQEFEDYLHEAEEWVEDNCYLLANGLNDPMCRVHTSVTCTILAYAYNA